MIFSPTVDLTTTPFPTPTRKTKCSSSLQPFVFPPPSIARIRVNILDPITAGNDSLPVGLHRDSIQKHVAVIIDGNGRWAHLRGLSVGSGCEAGVKSLKTLVELCSKWGIRVLTVFAFSTDYWFRPKVEVEFLMSLLQSGVMEVENSFL